jgi:hypothetical protein
MAKRPRPEAQKRLSYVRCKNAVNFIESSGIMQGKVKRSKRGSELPYAVFVDGQVLFGNPQTLHVDLRHERPDVNVQHYGTFFEDAGKMIHGRNSVSVGRKLQKVPDHLMRQIESKLNRELRKNGHQQSLKFIPF